MKTALAVLVLVLSGCATENAIQRRQIAYRLKACTGRALPGLPPRWSPGLVELERRCLRESAEQCQAVGLENSCGADLLW